jgi:hypothetical protein
MTESDKSKKSRHHPGSIDFPVQQCSSWMFGFFRLWVSVKKNAEQCSRIGKN